MNYDPRAKSISLSGKRWRLHVTWTPPGYDIDSIHTPYDRPLALTRDSDNVAVRLVGLDGAILEQVEDEVPFKVEAQFNKAPETMVEAKISWKGGAAPAYLAPSKGSAPGRVDFKIQRSGVFYVRSQKRAAIKDHQGLFQVQNKRYYNERDLKYQLGEWERQTKRSEADTSELYKGQWTVAHVTTGDGGPMIGAANVAEDGKSARLVLVGKVEKRLYKSIEIRTLRSEKENDHHLTVRFERVSSFAGKAPESAGLKPLIEGEFLELPGITLRLNAQVKDAESSAAVSLKPPPRERIRVRLRQRSEGRLAGHWHQENLDGSYGLQGRETWHRDARIAGIVVLENQRKRDPPTRAYYPFGPSKRLGSSTERTLFVYGRNLPVGHGDAIVFESGSEGVTYPRYRLLAEVGRHTVAEAWARAKAQEDLKRQARKKAAEKEAAKKRHCREGYAGRYRTGRNRSPRRNSIRRITTPSSLSAGSTRRDRCTVTSS